MVAFVPDFRELIKSFRHSADASRALAESGDDTLIPASRMLKFYAVECGLKSLLIREAGGSTLFKSHDISEMIKELRIDSFGWPPTFKVRKDKASHASKHSHLAWRYGVRVAARCDPKLDIGLSRLVEYIESRM